MLDAIRNMDEDVKVLEVVSDAEEMAVTLDSEHEEGEISEDDDDDDEVELPGQHFPHHYPSDYHKERPQGKNSSATSAVVIYDDRGRTAIFTSPRKNLRNSSSYKRRADSARRWEQEEMEKRRHREEEARKHQKDNGKENKRSGTASRARSRSPAEQGFSSSKKKLAHKKSSEKWPSKISPPWVPPVTQDKESTRTSSPDEAAGKISKSWGNGRKSPRPYIRHTLSTSSSRKTAVKASHHKAHKSKLKESVIKISDDNSEEKSDKSPKGKCDTSEGPLISSQKQLPRGSFGEMLLKKTLKGKLKVCPPASKTVGKEETSGEAGTSKKEELAEISEVLQQDCDTLDQEDEDELQLRLIALQSSLKVLSDVRREGCQSMNIGSMIVDFPLSLPQDSAEQPVEKEEIEKEAASGFVPDQKNVENISCFQNQLSEHHLQLESAAEGSANIAGNQNLDTRLEEGTPKDDEEDLILDDLSQSSTKSQPGSSITGLELELDAISTNKSYLDDGEDSTRQLATNIEEQLQREIKDLADSNQDPVDMDICDSSPGEEDETFFDKDILKDIGEDISLDKVSSPDPSSAPNMGSQAKNYPVAVLDPGGQENFHHSNSNNTKSSSNNNSNSNFQIPVEWAYMMPPPPPPDQPPNDISNINNWCYDQNMYLQTMQSSYDSNEQYQQYSTYGTPTPDWRLQPQQPAQWNESRPENYENIPEQPENIQENAEMPASPEVAASKTHTPEKEESNPDNSPQEDLKDLPAEHYQAFMSAVLNQQKTQQKSSSSTQRNLIEVQLIRYSNSSNSQAEPAKTAFPSSGTSGGAVLQVNKRSRARRRKRERQKEKIKQLKQLKAQEKLAKGKESIIQIDLQPGPDSVPSVSEDEDEDLLRAQLLIDLSRKKTQKQIEPVVDLPKSSSLTDYQAVAIDNMSATHQDRFDSHTSGYMGHESTPPLSYPSSLESSPRPRPVSKMSLVKVHQIQARIRENSPTHKMKVNMRPGLSDIGGFGLDPKSSRYDFPIPKDSHSQKDMPKFKFPNIKPVIINLESDSDDENEDGEESCQDEPQPSGSGEGEGVLSSSIDLLLKSMRNANKPEIKQGKASTSVKKGSALPKKTPVQKAPQSYSTPNVVRHLSRTQQVEYRRLKEQLREKEMLQRKRQELLLRQKVLSKKMASAARISPESPQSGDNGGETSDGGLPRDQLSVTLPHVKNNTAPKREEDSCDIVNNGNNNQTRRGTASQPSSVLRDTREVIVKETGGLQIQLANVSSPVNADKSSQAGSETVKSLEASKDKYSSGECSPVEDEDEEMLRLMVLKTLQKKGVEKARSDREENKRSVNIDRKSEKDEEPFMSSSSETLRVVIRQNLDDVVTDEKETKEELLEVVACSVVMENETDLPEKSKEIHQEETDVDVGEWMVLDEVLGESGEGIGENANSEELAVIKEEEGNKGKKLLIGEGDNGDASDCRETENPTSGSVSRTSGTVCLVQDVKDTSVCSNVSHVTESEGTEVENQTTVVYAQGEADEEIKKETECVSKETSNKEIEQCDNSVDMDNGKIEAIEDNGVDREASVSSKQVVGYKEEDTQNVPIKVSKKSVVEPVDKVLPFTTQEDFNSEKTEKLTEVEASNQSQDEESNNLSACKQEQASPSGKLLIDDDSDIEHPNQQKSPVREENLEDNAGLEVKDPNGRMSEDTVQKQVETHGETEGRKSEQLSEKAEKTEQLEDISLVSESTKMGKTTSLCNTPVNKSVRQISAIRIQDTFPAAQQTQKSNAVGNASKSSSLSNTTNLTRKPVRTKRLLLLKRVEHEYTQKRIAMNEVISQLASLVHEATEEERQRQSLKSTITKLREKLGQMETQLEDKASKLKAKMARIRNLQTQITKDREEISQLEHKGEILGKKELGSDYKLPKVLGSPHSKSKDHMRKKQLAHNIDALRQQIGQVYNRQMYSKNQARIEAKTKTIEKHISPSINLDKKEDGTDVRRKILHSGQASVGQNLSTGLALHITPALSLTQNVANASVAWSTKLSDSSSDMQSAGSIKGAPSMIKNKVAVKRKMLLDSGSMSTKAAKMENARASKGTEMTAIIDDKSHETSENLLTKESEHERGTVHPAKQQSAVSNKESVSCEEIRSQKYVSTSSEQTRSSDVTGKIDEMNMLCPYDLLGRCNDDSCSYQHLRHPRRMTSKTTEVQEDPTGLLSHTSVVDRPSGASDKHTVRTDSLIETKLEGPLASNDSDENDDIKADTKQTAPQVDCKMDCLQNEDESHTPSSNEGENNLVLCQADKGEITAIILDQNCKGSEENSGAVMSTCDKSDSLKQLVDNNVENCEKIMVTRCIDSELSEKSETIVSSEEAVVVSEILEVSKDNHKTLQSALPFHLKENKADVFMNSSDISSAEAFVEIKNVYVNTKDLQKDIESAEMFKENIKESGEKEEPKESVTEAPMPIHEKASSGERDNESRADIKEASTTALKQKKKIPPKRCTPRKRTRNSDLTLDLDTSQNTEPTARRTRRSINKKGVTGARVATNKNSSKKDSPKERSTPVKASPRRGGRKARGGKR
ncbi:uncharacterized protein LOC122255135 isoform X2 [Penaeus japonicus]|uniref:uncharacterized protein LOC122255135 isoform X2 n=1 Tax=Penaeus japonicus TaxID=27405 RepID=UPI001C70FC85|nr:uncharacterized protein LOC122255135 isoform X2 [Penaeus japonicus]